MTVVRRLGWLVSLLSCAVLMYADHARAQGADVGSKAPLRTELELGRAEIQANRQVIVANALKLSAQESEKFWPLYRESQAELGKGTDRMASLIVEFTEAYPNQSADEAEGQIEELLKIQTAQLKVKQKYLSKFKKILPLIKVARYYQLENKLDAVINLELARTIPLIF